MSSGLFLKFLLISISLHALAVGVIGMTKSDIKNITTYPILINYIEKKDHNILDSKIVNKTITKKRFRSSNKLNVKKNLNQNATMSVNKIKKTNTNSQKSVFTGQPKNIEEKNNIIESSKIVASDLAYPDYKINPKPKYPLVAQRRGIEGELYLQVYVLDNGKVGQLMLYKPSGYSFFDESAIKAVKDWVFVPGKRNGEPVSTWVTVPIKFQLTKL